MQNTVMFNKCVLNTAALMTGLTLGSIAFANPFETTLDNGMKVIVKEDRRAPSVVHMIWYGAGAMDEPEGVSGIAHMMEHMMFKGSEHVGPGEFSKRVAAVGGRDNAFTSRDYTAYFQQIPPQFLDEMMTMEADRMASLVVTDKEFQPERKVVAEERRLRTDDNPQALMFEQLMATTYKAHPYRRPVIGWMSDIASYTADDVQKWHDHWYVPNNAWLIVVGDINHDDVFAMASKHYGSIPSRPLPPRRISEEPLQRGMRSVIVEAPAELPMLAMVWHVPTLRDTAKDRDPYALQVLSAVLDGYDGARLGRKLVREQQIAVSAGASYSGINRGPSLFYLTAIPGEGHTTAEVEAALRAELARIQIDGISEEELKRVKTQTIAAQVFKRDSLMGQAMEMGFLEASGYTWQDDNVTLEGLRQVTAREVQDVANRYFFDKTLTRTELKPLKIQTSQPHQD